MIHTPSIEQCRLFSSCLKILSQETAKLEDWVLYDPQIEILQQLIMFEKNIILKGRQLGISTVCLFFISLLALLNPGSSVCIVAHTDDTAAGLLKKIKSFMDQLGMGMPSNNYRSITLSNGSTFDAMSATSQVEGESKVGRSKTYTILLLSEVAFYRDSQSVFAALSSSSTPNARIILESTATPHDTIFRHIWDKSEDYERTFIGLEQHQNYQKDPDSITDEVWEELKGRHGFSSRPHAAFWYAKLNSEFAGDEPRILREYPILEHQSWTASSGRWIGLDPKVLPHILQSRTEEYTIPDPQHYYIAGVDIAAGVGHDYSVITVYDLNDRTISAMYASNTTPADDLVAELVFLDGRYKFLRIYMEANGIGQVPVQLANKARLPVTPVNTTASNRYSGMLLVKRAVESGLAAGDFFLQNCKSCQIKYSGGREDFAGLKDALMSLSFILLNAPLYKEQIKKEKPMVRLPNTFNQDALLEQVRQQNKNKSGQFPRNPMS